MLPGALAVVAILCARGCCSREATGKYDYKADGDQVMFAYGAMSRRGSPVLPDFRQPVAHGSDGRVGANGRRFPPGGSEGTVAMMFSFSLIRSHICRMQHSRASLPMP